jgi:hypothetical protein
MNKRKLFLFNPTCEMALANGEPSYMPPQHLRHFENDLATLPCFLGNENDFVLTHEKLNPQFIEYLKCLGFNTTQFILSHNELNLSDNLDLLCPWGWSLSAHKKLNSFLPFCNDKWFQHPMAKWLNTHPQLLSRETTSVFKKLLFNIDCKDYPLLEIPTPPVKIETLESLKTITNYIKPPILLKTPWSASGRGLFKIRDINEHVEQNDWIKSKLRQQKCFYAEQYLKKLLDVSFHFIIETDSIRFIGNTFFETDIKGQFLGCHIRFPENKNLDKILLTNACEQATDLLLKGLQLLNINKQYQGPLGIDAIFFENDNGKIKLNPCVEINLRHTMGLLNIFLRNRIHPEKTGYWKIVTETVNQEELKLPQKHLKEGFIYNGTILLTLPLNKSGNIARLQLS